MFSTRRQAVKATIYLTGLLCLMAAVVVLTSWALATDNPAPLQQRQPRAGQQAAASSLIKVGQLAPDFELPILTFDTDAAGKPIGRISGANVIKLSSYFGKKPVCLIMSSYT